MGAVARDAQHRGSRAQRERRATFSRERLKVAEPADKPGSVVDSHSSGRSVTATLEQPTRTRRGPRHGVPIWPCSRWGLPCRPVARLAVRSYRTISPLPRAPRGAVRRYLSVALSVGSRRPGVTWHRALWSPDFPRHPRKGDATAWPTPPPASYRLPRSAAAQQTEQVGSGPSGRGSTTLHKAFISNIETKQRVVDKPLTSL